MYVEKEAHSLGEGVKVHQQLTVCNLGLEIDLLLLM